MKYEFATDEWFAEALRSAERLDPVPGVDVKQQMVITDAPNGTIMYFEEIRDGKMRRLFSGEGPDPDVVVTLSYADYQRLFRDGISSDQLPTPPRVEGDVAKVGHLVPIRRTSAFARHRAHLRDVTVWPQ